MRKYILAIAAITLIAGFLRFYHITKNPPGLTGDEISYGYAAYSILKTSKDEHGKFLPITLESVGDYKNPLQAYLMIPSIMIFGLTDFAIRFPNAFMGVVTVPFFFLFLLDIFKDKKLALVGSLFVATSTWHIFYSRFAYEYIIASLFILLGIWLFIKMLQRKSFWASLGSAFFFSITLYTAPAVRLFVPAFVLAALLISLRLLKRNLYNLRVFLLVCLILGLPMVYATLFLGAGTRFSAVFLINDVEFARYVLLGHFRTPLDLPYLFFFWIKRYLSYLDPSFLFLNGLDITYPGPIGLGIFYFFEIPFLIVGAVKFIRSKFSYKNIFILWLLIGILPDSLTNNQRHAGRLLHIFPVAMYISALGAVEIFNWIKSLKNIYFKRIIILTLAVAIFLSFTHAFLMVSYNFPRDKGEQYDEGLREVVGFISQNQHNYDEIVFDTRRGIDAPSMITNSYLYLLFYLKYDPKVYQTEPKTFGEPNNPDYHFGKYTFRYIDWHQDCFKKGILFIGSPWSFPENLAGVKIIETFRLTRGEVAFYVVTTTLDCPYRN